MSSRPRTTTCVFITASLALSLSCATIVSDSSYPVEINSQPAEAIVTVKDEDGNVVHTGTTPTTVTLRAGAGYFRGQNYSVSFEKPGYAKHTTSVTRSIDGWYLGGNLIVGGLLGWLIIDPITGAMWKLEHVNVRLERNSSQIPEGQGLRIATLDQLPPELVSQLERIR